MRVKKSGFQLLRNTKVDQFSGLGSWEWLALPLAADGDVRSAQAPYTVTLRPKASPTGLGRFRELLRLQLKRLRDIFPRLVS